MVSISPADSRRGVEFEEVRPLNAYLEKIIDKKANEVALTIFERFIDFMCTYLYATYNERLAFRLKELDLEEVKEEQDVEGDTDPARATAQKVHHFMDGAPLYDRTSAQRVSIDCRMSVGIITAGQLLEMDQIKIDGKPVLFTTHPKSVLVFGTKYGTKEVFVTDNQECPELVIIYERETTNHLKAWSVDTAHPTQKIVIEGEVETARREVFLAKEIDLQSTPAPIVAQFP